MLKRDHSAEMALCKIHFILLTFLGCFVGESLGKPKRIEPSEQGSGSRDINHWQGDIYLPRDKPGQFRNALLQTSHAKWPGAKIPYYLPAGTYNQVQENTIKQAMNKIAAKTCVQFVPYTGQQDYIQFQNKNGEGCYSTVGRDRGMNTVSLEHNNERTCLDYDIVIHELLHVCGLWHEHMRYDRDNYVTIQYNHVRPGYDSQFDVISSQESSTYNIPYDYKSVMHYKATAFSKDGIETILPRAMNGLSVSAIEQFMGFATDASENDFAKVNKIYQCPQQQGGGGGGSSRPIGSSCSTADTCQGGSTCRFSVCQCNNGQIVQNGVCANGNTNALPGQSCGVGRVCQQSYCNTGTGRCTCFSNQQLSGNTCIAGRPTKLPGELCYNGYYSCSGGSTCTGQYCTCNNGQIARNGQCVANNNASPGQSCSNGQTCTGNSFCGWNGGSSFICKCQQGYFISNNQCTASFGGGGSCTDTASSTVCRRYTNHCRESYMTSSNIGYCKRTCCDFANVCNAAASCFRAGK